MNNNSEELAFSFVAVFCAESLHSCLTLGNPIDCSPQAPLSVGFSREEC